MPSRRVALLFATFSAALSCCGGGEEEGTETLAPETTPNDADTVSRFVVALGRPPDNWWCSAVVVDATHVVTAQHCLRHEGLDATHLMLDDHEPPHQRRRIVPTDSQGNVALLALASDESPISGVTPIGLARSCHAASLGPGEASYQLIGYGLRGVMSTAIAERRLRLGFGHGSSCLGADTSNQCNTSREFAVKPQPGWASACNHDSGGALIASAGGQQVLFGITERRLSADTDNACESGAVGTRTWALPAGFLSSYFASCPSHWRGTNR